MSGFALAHGAERFSLTLDLGSTVSLLAAVLAIVGARRIWTWRGRAMIVAGTLALFVLWAQPWMSFHDTHHLLEGKAHASLVADDDSCPVAQIAQAHAGGILPATVAPALPIPEGPVVPVDLAAYPTHVVPEPAARSPPV